MSNLCKVDKDYEDDIEKEIQCIEKLDESINDLDLKLKEVSNELSNLQFKNRQILKESMVSHIEIGRLAENTDKYLNLYSIDMLREKTSESANDLSRKSTQDLTCDIKDSSAVDTKVLSITDEEKLQLESLLHNDSETNKSIEVILEHNYDNQPNPYKLNEKSIKSLEELDKKLEFPENQNKKKSNPDRF